MTTVWLWLYPFPLKSDVDLAAGEIIHAQWFCEGAAQVAKLGVRSRGSGYTALKAFENTASWYRHRLRTGHV